VFFTSSDIKISVIEGLKVTEAHRWLISDRFKWIKRLIRYLSWCLVVLGISVLGHERSELERKSGCENGVIGGNS
jgi:hypothetical protein